MPKLQRVSWAAGACINCIYNKKQKAMVQSAGHVRGGPSILDHVSHCYFHLLCATGYDFSKCIDRSGPNTASGVQSVAFL
jgi:hypothetical protein